MAQTYARRREHWIFIDSRGTDLYELIKAKRPAEFIGVWRKSGATLGDLVQLASKHLLSYPYDIVYVVGGVNDITTKYKRSGKIAFEWSPPELIMQHLTAQLKTADDALSRDFPASKVVFCTLVGLELALVVNSHPVSQLQQLAVNEAVFDFNNEVFKINKRRGTFSPSLHRTIHRTKNGRRMCYYEHLEDGLHLSDSIKAKWAAEFTKAASRN